MRRHFRLPSASTVIATTALIAALGGTSYAASTISSKNIKNNSVTGKDIKNNSLTTTDIKNGTLRARDFKKSDAPVGPQGPAGPSGPAGPKGIGTLVYVDSEITEVPAGEEGYAAVACPDGTFPTGGGAITSSNPIDDTPPFAARDVTINSSFATSDGTVGIWEVYVENFSGVEQEVQAHAVCADAVTAGNVAKVTKKSRARSGR